MNFFDFEQRLYSGEQTAMDDSIGEAAAELARKAVPNAPHHQDSSAEVIAEFTSKDKVLSAEEIIEHRKHCRAKPGNCPFEKAKDEADEITPKDIKITKQNVYNRLAAILTQMFMMAKNLAKPAIAEPEKVEAKASPTTAADKAPKASPTKVVQDEAPPDEPNTDAKIVAEIIEGGIEKMVELARGKGCLVDMNEQNTKYIVRGPAPETSMG